MYMDKALQSEMGIGADKWVFLQSPFFTTFFIIISFTFSKIFRYSRSFNEIIFLLGLICLMRIIILLFYEENYEVIKNTVESGVEAK